MKHKLIFFAMAVFLCLGLISCNQAMAGLPEWLSEEVMDQPVQQFEAVYTAEGDVLFSIPVAWQEVTEVG